jgi:hypothetical protein
VEPSVDDGQEVFLKLVSGSRCLLHGSRFGVSRSLVESFVRRPSDASCQVRAVGFTPWVG